MKLLIKIVFLVILILVLSGCRTDDAMTMYLLNARLEKLEKIEKTETSKVTANQVDTNKTITIWIKNYNNSRQPVVLKCVDRAYIGPNGEVYDTLPTVEDLTPYYRLNKK